MVGAWGAACKALSYMAGGSVVPVLVHCAHAESLSSRARDGSRGGLLMIHAIVGSVALLLW